MKYSMQFQTELVWYIPDKTLELAISIISTHIAWLQHTPIVHLEHYTQISCCGGMWDYHVVKKILCYNDMSQFVSKF